MKRKKPTNTLIGLADTNNGSTSSPSSSKNDAVVVTNPSQNSNGNKKKMIKKKKKTAMKMKMSPTLDSVAIDTTISSASVGWRPIDSSELTLYQDDISDHHHYLPSHATVVNYDQNHYDDDDTDNNNDHDDPSSMGLLPTPRKKRQRLTSTKVVQRDLLGQPHEPMGIFYRLEVMDGNVASALISSSSSLKEPPQPSSNTTIISTTTESTSPPKIAEEHITTAITTKRATVDQSLHCDVATTKVDRNSKKQKIMDPTTTTSTGSTTTTNKKTKTAPTTTTTRNERVTTAAAVTKVADITNYNSDHPTKDDTTDTTTNTTIHQDDQVLQVQNIWFKECQYAVQLHMVICLALLREGWMTPTPIQSAALPATILGQCNFVGAAPTGSGKTLAFLLPMFHTIYTQLDDNPSSLQSPLPLQALIVTPTRELALQIYQVGMKLCISPSSVSSSSSSSLSSTIPQAKLYSTVSIACITGGLAAAKQIRILQSKYRPPTVLVGTPGRLWELISSRLYPHLNNLSHLRFLVIDEADQMVDMKVTSSSSKSGRYKFPELIQILNVIHTANPMMENDNENDPNMEDDIDDEDMDTNRMLGLPGIPGEARVTMMDETLLQQIQQQQEQELQHEQGPANVEDDYSYDNDDVDEEGILIAHHLENYSDDDDNEEKDASYAAAAAADDDDDDTSLPVSPPVRRQTFVFSATLTLPDGHHHTNDGKHASANDGKKKSKKNKKTCDESNLKKNEALSNVHGAIADLLQKAHAVGRTKVVDLTNGTDVGKSRASSTVVGPPNHTSTSTAPYGSPAPVTKEFQFPPGLQFQQMLCTQRHKDSHLYGYILYFMSSLSKNKNPSHQSSILIFCNSIAGVRRVGMTLTTLRLPVRILHANMQQRARFKAVESLQQEDSIGGKNQFPTIVVATDVAARGLDIPSVATVIHYDAARTVDTFIHRSGRTARGIGDGAVGCSVSIVASGEDQVHNRIKKMLNVQFQEVPIDGRLLRIAQERVNLACKVATADDTDRKNQRDDQWFIDQAKQAGLEVDDDLLNNVTRDADDLGSRRNKDSNMRQKARQKEAEIARKRLNELLSQPVQTQRYGKFFRVGSG